MLFGLLLVLATPTAVHAGLRLGSLANETRSNALTLDADVSDDDKFTLVQYIGSEFCTGSRFVCESLTLDQMTSFKHYFDAKVCSTVKAVDADANKYQVDSCLAEADKCPTECDCNLPEPLHFVIGDCHFGQSFSDNAKVSWKLVKGAQEGCVTTRQDAGLARWCDKYPTLLNAYRIGEDFSKCAKGKIKFKKGEGVTPKPTVSDCEALCAASPECTFFTYYQVHGGCVIFSGDCEKTKPAPKGKGVLYKMPGKSSSLIQRNHLQKQVLLPA